MRVRLRHRVLARHIVESRLSQNGWAHKVGLSSGHLSLLVNGRRPYPTARTRKRLMQGTGLDFEQLFELEDPPGFAVEGFLKLVIADLGLEAEGVFTFRTHPIRQDLTLGEGRSRFFQAALEELQRIPRIRSVGAIQALPIDESGWIQPSTSREKARSKEFPGALCWVIISVRWGFDFCGGAVSRAATGPALLL